MLFRRRNTESFWTRLRVHAWPRTSWSRSSRYVVYRVSATPHAVALGFAAGAFSAITPFLGTHIVMAIAIAWIIGGSLVAAVLGTFLGNPLTRMSCPFNEQLDQSAGGAALAPVLGCSQYDGNY